MEAWGIEIIKKKMVLGCWPPVGHCVSPPEIVSKVLKL